MHNDVSDGGIRRLTDAVILVMLDFSNWNDFVQNKLDSHIHDELNFFLEIKNNHSDD